jgi:proteasome component ECM29
MILFLNTLLFPQKPFSTPFFPSQTAGLAAIRPHVSELAPTLLESLSATEDARLNYIEQHAASVGVSREDVQSARVSASRSHPLSEALESLSRTVDEASLPDLVPRLAAVIKRGTGLTTRAGAARFTLQLAIRLGPQLRAPAPQLTKALIESMRSDPSNTVRKADAAALAQVLKHAAPSRLDKTLEDLLTPIFGAYCGPSSASAAEGGTGTAGSGTTAPAAAAAPSGTRDDRLILGLILSELVRAAPESYAQLQARALPGIFFLRFDAEDPEVAALFTAVWEGGATSESTALSEWIFRSLLLLLDCSSCTVSRLLDFPD